MIRRSLIADPKALANQRQTHDPNLGTSGWALAAGLSIAAHIGLAGGLVLLLAAPPGAAPGPATEIVLRNLPTMVGGGATRATRLVAIAPDTRLRAQDDPEAAPAAQTLASQPPVPARTEGTLAAVTAQPLRPSTMRPDPAQPDPAQSGTARPETLRPETLRPEGPRAEVTLVEPGRSLADREPVPDLIAPAAPIPATLASTVADLLPTPEAADSAQRDHPRASLSDRQAAPRPTSGASVPPLAPATGDPAILAGPVPSDSVATGPATGDQASYAAVRDYVRARPEAPCLLALPLLDAEGVLRLDVFGPTTAALDGFRSGLVAEMGLVPGLAMQSVTPDQCETLAFFGRNPDLQEATLSITLEAQHLAPGASLRGQVQSVGARNADSSDFGTRRLHFLLINPTGQVQGLEHFVQTLQRPARAEFDIPAAVLGAPGGGTHLLLAIIVETALDAAPMGSEPQEAAVVFARLQAEILSRATRPSLALIAFTVN